MAWSVIIDDRKFDDETSTLLHKSGDHNCLHPENGILEIYRSPRGIRWGRLYYWASETRDVEVLRAGDEGVRELIRLARRPRAIEDVFGPVEMG